MRSFQVVAPEHIKASAPPPSLAPNPPAASLAYRARRTGIEYFGAALGSCHTGIEFFRAAAAAATAAFGLPMIAVAVAAPAGISHR